MREVEQAADAFVDELRDALSPNDADQARVLAAIESQIGVTNTGGLPTAHGPSGSWGMRARLAGPIGLSVVAAFVIGAGVTSRWRASHVAKPSQPPQLMAAQTQPMPTAVPEPPSTAVVSPELTTVAVSKPASIPSRPRHRVVVAQPAADVSLVSNEPSTLRIELEALQSAERALRDRQPERALEILDACDREVPAGRMREERLAASTVARCALYRDQAGALLDEFGRVYPHSAYTSRVSRSCVTR